MDLLQIESFLDSANPQLRMKAIVELRHHEADVVVPLLKRRMHDRQFMVRSFVAMGLGYKRNDEAFEALLDMLRNETDHNVLAEVANSLEKFGPKAISYLVTLFEQQPHWLVRQSIFAALENLDRPEILWKLCDLGFNGDDPTVKLVAIAHLGRLKQTPHAPQALEMLLQAAVDGDAPVRAEVARSLRHFDDQAAQAALAELRQDRDYRVVAAVLQGLL
jgi:HEAT repeat protein